MSSPVPPHPSAAPSDDDTTPDDTAVPPAAPRRRQTRDLHAPRSPLLAKLTGLTSIATLAGFILILLGAVLFLLPLANWQFNLRGSRPMAAGV